MPQWFPLEKLVCSSNGAPNLEGNASLAAISSLLKCCPPFSNQNKTLGCSLGLFIANSGTSKQNLSPSKLCSNCELPCADALPQAGLGFWTAALDQHSCPSATSRKTAPLRARFHFLSQLSRANKN